MPQSQIIRSPADVSDFQASGRLDTSEPVAVRWVTRTRPFMGAGRASADDRTAIGQFEKSFWVERQIVNRTTTGRCSDGYRRNIEVAPQESRKVLINRTSIWRASAGLLAGIGRTPQGKRVAPSGKWYICNACSP